MNILFDFFYMHGYGFYIFSAYGSVIIFLFIQWFLPWRRWKKYFRKQQS
ncbi:MAG: heme exporter protein CcmD [Gammaproteobacteria bacterium RIFCSPHIGHO2_12_FULL_37_14]|nr:MAG: heme exporter protein CcmD [Gammaproteobacteria bacterium RIFCSPHIGHO2_12_FULL_37_14]